MVQKYENPLGISPKRAKKWGVRGVEPRIRRTNRRVV